MKEWKAQAKELVEQLWNFYMAREIERLMELLVEDIVWTGIYEGSCLMGKQKVKLYLQQLKKYPQFLVSNDYHVIFRDEHSIIVTGVLNTISKEEKEKNKENRICFTVVCASKYGNLQVIHIHLSEKKPLDKSEIYCVQAQDKHIYYFNDKDIFYIEASDNSIILHGINQTIKAWGTLTAFEKRLSSNFLKIHRSFIINRNYVSSIYRCWVKMKNGDILPVPSRHYCKIKMELAKSL